MPKSPHRIISFPALEGIRHTAEATGAAMKSYNVDIDKLEGLSIWPEHVRINAVIEVKVEEVPNAGDIRSHLHISRADAKKLHKLLTNAINEGL
jgi:hypothetical protein